MRVRKVILWLGVLLAAMLALGGCQTASAEPTATTASAQPTVTAESGFTPTVAPTLMPTYTPIPRVSLAESFPPTEYTGALPANVTSVIGLGELREHSISPHGIYILAEFAMGLGLYHADMLKPLWFRPDLVGYYEEMRWSPDGSKVALVRFDNLIMLEMPTGNLLYQRHADCGECYWAYGWRDVIWSPDSSRFVLQKDPGFGGPLILTADDGTETVTLNPIVVDAAIRDIQWSADGQLIAGTVARFTDVYFSALWSPTHSEPIQRLSVTADQWSPDLSLLTVGGPESIAIYTSDDQRLMYADGHPAVSPDWSSVLTINAASIHLWDIATQSQIWSIPNAHHDEVWLDWLPDGSGFVAYGQQTLTLYDLETHSERYTLEKVAPQTDLETSINPVFIDWSTNGSFIATRAFGYGVPDFKFWDASSGQLLNTLFIDEVGYPEFIAEHENLAVLDSGNGIAIWDLPSQQPVARISTSSEYEYAWSKDSTRLATFASINQFAVWDPLSGSFLGLIDKNGAVDFEFDETVIDDQLSPDGTRKFEILEVESNEPFTVELRDAQTNILLGTSRFFATGDAPRRAVYWSPDGQYLFVYYSGSFDIWDAHTGQVVISDGGNNVIFSPDSSMVAWNRGGAIHVRRLR